MIGVIVAPCKDCPQKGCGAYHDQCEKFKAYKADRKAFYEDTKKRNTTVRCGKRRQLNDL